MPLRGRPGRAARGPCGGPSGSAARVGADRGGGEMGEAVAGGQRGLPVPLRVVVADAQVIGAVAAPRPVLEHEVLQDQPGPQMRELRIETLSAARRSGRRSGNGR